MGAASGAVIIAAVVYVLLAVTAFRRPLLARIAVRELIRRPLQSLVVVSGLTVGTGAILGPQLWYDSITDSLIAAAFREWGRIDIAVAAGGSSFDAEIAERLATDPTIRSSVGGVQAGLDLVASVSNPDQRLDLSAIRLVGFDPAAQPAFGAYILDDGTHSYGENLASGEVLLSQSLADSLRARPGDRIRVSSGGRATDVKVAGVAKAEGPGVYGLRPAVFAPLPTVRNLAGPGSINVIWITANGDGQAEADAARSAAPRIRAALAGLNAGRAFDVREVKAKEAEAFNRYREDTSWVFLSFSLLVVAIGTALVVNLILSLADERRPRLAVLRALGLSRAGQVSLLMLEGGVYSLGAALLSLVTGGAIALVLFTYSSNASLGDINGRDVVFQLSMRPWTIATATALGVLITLFTVLVAAVRSSGMTIASAIKDLPDREPARRRSWFALVWVVALAVAGILALLADDPRLTFIGGWALIAVSSALTRGRLSERARATVTGAVLTAWVPVMFSAYGPSSLDLDLSIQIYFLGIATMVFGLSILVASNLRLLESFAGLVGAAAPGLQATLRPPLAYMTRRPMRAGLTIGVLGLVVASITNLTVAAAMTGRPDYARDSGGFDVEVTSAGSGVLTLPARVQGNVARVVSIPTRRYIGTELQSFGSGEVATDWHEQLEPLYELSDAIIGSPLPRLSQRDASFRTDADVWRAVATDPTWIISSWWGGHGGRVSLYGRDGPVELKIAGSFAPGLLDGIAGSAEALAPFAGLPVGATLLVRARDGTDAQTLALGIRRAMFSQGVEATTTRALLDQGQVQSRTWGSIFRLLSLIGLVAGVLSLGVLAFRAVLERRRAIAILRALGSQPRSILAGILIEAMLTTGLAIVVGLAAGLVAIDALLNANAKVAPIPSLDVADIALSLVLIYAALLAVTMVVSIGPALKASRLAPVDAIRMVD
jgi:putative ABC transport system permease protein